MNNSASVLERRITMVWFDSVLFPLTRCLTVCSSRQRLCDQCGLSVVCSVLCAGLVWQKNSFDFIKTWCHDWDYQSEELFYCWLQLCSLWSSIPFHLPVYYASAKLLCFHCMSWSLSHCPNITFQRAAAEASYNCSCSLWLSGYSLFSVDSFITSIFGVVCFSICTFSSVKINK